jgi:signal transduction histidine kinase
MSSSSPDCPISVDPQRWGDECERLRQGDAMHRRIFAAIAAIGHEVASTQPLDRILQLVMDKAAETVPMDAGLIFRLDEEAQMYRVAVFIENARLVEQLRRATAEFEARVEERTRALREAQVQMVRTEKLAAVGRLAASLAHEINNPLQAVALHLELATEEASHPAQEELAIVRHELDRIAEIVRRLLDVHHPQQRPEILSWLPAHPVPCLDIAR